MGMGGESGHQRAAGPRPPWLNTKGKCGVETMWQQRFGPGGSAHQGAMQDLVRGQPQYIVHVIPPTLIYHPRPPLEFRLIQV